MKLMGGEGGREVGFALRSERVIIKIAIIHSRSGLYYGNFCFYAAPLLKRKLQERWNDGKNKKAGGALSC